MGSSKQNQVNSSASKIFIFTLYFIIPTYYKKHELEKTIDYIIINYGKIHTPIIKRVISIQ